MRILIVVTNVAAYASGRPTGLWLGELTHLFHEASVQGFEIVIASPRGGKAPIDPESLKFPMIDQLSKQLLADKGFRMLLANTESLGELTGEEFDCIYLTGGHGTMYDFHDDANLQALVSDHYERGKLVAAVCHGPAGLLNVRLSDGEHLIRERKVTGYSWFEESLARRKSEVPFNLEEQLQQRGANYGKALIPMTSKVVEDGNLITGQNPFSSKAIARKVMERLLE